MSTIGAQGFNPVLSLVNDRSLFETATDGRGMK
jgi:hypothetical protein